MSSRRWSFNPFYPLLVLAGVAFTVSACAYGVMLYDSLKPAGQQSSSPLLEFMNQRGTLLLGVELAVLAVASVAAIGWDHLRTANKSGVTFDDK